MGLVRKVGLACERVKVPIARGLPLTDFLSQTFRQAGEDYLGAFAAGLAYRGLFATFLFLLFLLSLLGIFHASDVVSTLLDRVSLAMPGAVRTIIRDQTVSLTQLSAHKAFTLGAIISILAALWGISGAFRYAMQAMNVMYKVVDHRPLWKQYLISVLLSLAVAALMISAAVLVVFGASIGGKIADIVGLGSIFQWTWNVLQWPILVCCVLLAFALVYYYAPDVKQQFRFITPGSVIGVGLWLTFSLLFLFFVNSFGVYNRVYGALAGVAIHMLYMYYFSYILLLGAEINEVIEAHSPGGKKPGERVPRAERSP